MVNILYGPKGTGKTKQIIEMANSAAQQAKGNVIFVSKSKTYSVNINFDVKCIYTDEYNIDSVEAFRGFICGLAAGNYDIEYIFIDGVARICKTDLNGIAPIIDVAKSLNDIKFTFTISADKDELPDFLKVFA